MFQPTLLRRDEREMGQFPTWGVEFVRVKFMFPVRNMLLWATWRALHLLCACNLCIFQTV